MTSTELDAQALVKETPQQSHVIARAAPRGEQRPEPPSRGRGAVEGRHGRDPKKIVYYSPSRTA